MSASTGRSRLSIEQNYFKSMLGEYPRLHGFWDFEKIEFDGKLLENSIYALSHGEQLMARFFAAVWLGEDKFSFDFIEAARILDSQSKKTIIDWLENPVFP